MLRTLSYSPRLLLSKRAFSISRRQLKDPWFLPGTPEHLASTSTEDTLPTPLPRPDETPSTLRARLLYQSRKRGTLESDLLLSTFARDHLTSMSEVEMREYDKLLDEPDWDIYYWATGKRTPPERWTGSEILQRLTRHAKNEGKVVRMMPKLE